MALAESLQQLSTNWAELESACGDGPQAREAQSAVLRRYSRSIVDYLAAATGDPHIADDLAQEFALKFVRGDFRRLHPSRGRFRDFVKTVLAHLVADHFRARQTSPRALPPDSDDTLLDGHPGRSGDSTFSQYWRSALLDRAWKELRDIQSRGFAPLYDALKIRAENPEWSAEAAAQRLSERTGRPVSNVLFRQLVHRARRKFAELLRLEVAYSLGSREQDAVDRELSDLELLAYCPRQRTS